MKLLMSLILACNIHLSYQLCTTQHKTLQFRQYLQLNSRVLYTYMVCENIGTNFNYKQDLFKVVNESQQLQYVQVINSDIPYIYKVSFDSLAVPELRINDANVEVIAPGAFENANITSIDFENNKIHTISEKSFLNCSLVKILSFKNNSIRDVQPNTFQGLTDLRKLNLQYNFINYLSPDIFLHLESLQELDLSHNFISLIELKTFEPLKQLQTIFLSFNTITSLDRNLFNNTSNLQYVNINNNLIKDLNAKYFPKSVLFINASHNNLLSCDFTGLELDTLDLNMNNLFDMKHVLLGDLKNLSLLSINNNDLESSFFSFDNLISLNKISLSNNGIDLVRSSFSNKNLKEIDLSHNIIQMINFANYSKTLETLHLEFNNLNSLQNLSTLTNLRYLDLSDNELTTINYSLLKNLKILNYLNLNNNLIKNVEMGCFRDLEGLVHLSLANNKIVSAVSGIFHGLTSLKRLDLSHNNFSQFDETIFHSTTTLTMLNISYNGISNLSVKKITVYMPWLTELNLIGNNFTCKTLVSALKGNNYLRLTKGEDYAFKNIFGVACVDSEDSKGDSDSKLQISNLNRNVSYYFNVNNSIVCIIMLMLFCNYFYKYFSKYFYIKKQFAYGNVRPQHDIQMM